MDFCFSSRWNDHNAYPRSLCCSQPGGWRFRESAVVFDETYGRPWCRFMRKSDEIIYASSLIPTNASPWLLDTDHIEYLFMQGEQAARNSGSKYVRAKFADGLMRYLTS